MADIKSISRFPNKTFNDEPFNLKEIKIRKSDLPGHRPPDHHVPPKTLPGFPGAQRVKSKNQRARWKTPDGKILEWDYKKGEVEVYDKNGKNHECGFDPNTGQQRSPAVPGRTTDNFNDVEEDFRFFKILEKIIQKIPFRFPPVLLPPDTNRPFSPGYA